MVYRQPLEGEKKVGVPEARGEVEHSYRICQGLSKMLPPLF